MRYASGGKMAPQAGQRMDLPPSGFRFAREKSIRRSAAPQDGHTATFSYRLLHRSSPTAPTAAAAAPRGHKPVDRKSVV